MANINPNNYVGAELTLVGYLSSDPRPPAYDKDGERGILEFSIPVNQGYKNRDTGEFVQTGTTWYSYTATAEFLEPYGLQKGDMVRIDGAKQEVREYTAKDGTNKLGINLRYGDITVLKSAGGDEPPF